MYNVQAGTNVYRLIIVKARKLSFSTNFDLTKKSTGSIDARSAFLLFFDFADREMLLRIVTALVAAFLWQTSAQLAGENGF
jgi:hypothetical protein